MLKAKLQNYEPEEEINTFQDVALWLTKSPFTPKHNEYSLSLDDIISISHPDSIIEKCIIFNYMVDPEWMFTVCPILKDKSKVESIYLCHGESEDSHYEMCNWQANHQYDHLSIFKVKMSMAYGTHHTKVERI